MVETDLRFPVSLESRLGVFSGTEGGDTETKRKMTWMEESGRNTGLGGLRRVEPRKKETL